MATRLALDNASDRARLLVVMQNNRIAAECPNPPGALPGNPSGWTADLIGRAFYAPKTRVACYSATANSQILACISGSIWHEATEFDPNTGVSLGAQKWVSLNRVGIHTTVTNAQVISRFREMMKFVLSQVAAFGGTRVRYAGMPGSVVNQMIIDLAGDAVREDVGGGIVLNGAIPAWQTRYAPL